MRRLLIMIGVVSVALSLALALIRLLPNPVTAFEAMETPSCTLPCFLGIRPGATPLDEAKRMLKADPRIDPASVQMLSVTDNKAMRVISWNWNAATLQSLARYNPHWAEVEPSYVTGHETVENIDLNVYLQLTDLLQVKGSPPRAYVSARVDSADVGWYYPDANAFFRITFACSSASPQTTSHVFAIQLRAVQDFEPFLDFGPWRGVDDWQRSYCHLFHAP